jgi:hypothetical protein
MIEEIWEDRYKFPILKVIDILIGEISGSTCCGTSKEDLLYYKNCLQRRVNEWKHSRLHKFAEYESTVLSLAKQTLKFYE